MNKRIWKTYNSELENMAEKNNGIKPKEQYLFHGTRGTAPEMIYGQDEGFDVRFSSKGMWGKAIYFAKNALYSHAYRSKGPGLYQQMFYARVMTGNSKLMPENNSLKIPPLIEGSTKERYDSV